MPKKVRLQLKGQKFNHLLVLDFAYIKNGRSWWKCQCDCNNKVIINSNHLKSGNTKSCGCFRREVCRQEGLRRTKHGKRYTKIYSIYRGIRQRCLNINFPFYKNYGGRGIKICDRWFKFENFYNDMIKSYNKHCEQFGEKQTQIDRINNNGNYEPFNCKWSTPKENSNNKRNTNLTK